jgi:DNA polymerase III subunit epsilon
MRDLAAPGSRAAWRGGSFCVVDLETTGLDAEACEIVECALVELDWSGRLLSEWASLVRLSGAIGAREIHHIDGAMLGRAPRFDEIAGEIVARLRGRVVVGHVVAFDLAHLSTAFHRLGRPLPDLAPASLCTHALAAEAGFERPRTLAGCCAATGVEQRGAHTALGDARSAAALLGHFLEKGARAGLDQLVAAAGQIDWGCWAEERPPERPRPDDAVSHRSAIVASAAS